MPKRPREPFLLLLAVILAACSPGADPADCRSDDGCPASSRCASRVCVGDARPVAAIGPIGSVEAFALVELDGSGSRDPDAGDEIVDHAWSIRAMTARCAPPDVASHTPTAHLRFGCPGRYEVSLTVHDRLGVESEPAVATVDVAPSTVPAAIVAGPDLSTEHTCSGEPLVCRPVDPIVLSASTTVPGVSLRWTVDPPADRPLADGTRRVDFSGSADSPAVSIETDGTAISGDWIFRVEAYDAYGVIGAAYTRVSVRNRAPVVEFEQSSPFPHAFDASRARFTCSGEVAWKVADPDGDPIETSATWRHVGDGGAPFSGQLRADTVTFALEVPYAQPADALFLRGGENLARTIDLVARDPNRAEGRASIPIEVGNRPPEPAGGVVDSRVPHRFDPTRSRYVATVQLGSWVDPDGDPLFAGPGTAPCDAVSVVDGVARAECSVPFDGVPAVDQLAGSRVVPAPVRDPWSLAATVPVYRAEILNSPPTLARTTDPATFCWQPVFTGNFSCPWKLLMSAMEFTAYPTAVDPDGDPLAVTALPASGGSASPQQAICTKPECVPFRFVQPAVLFPCISDFVPPSWLRASDGAASVTIPAIPDPTHC